ncbi:MAG: DNA polymerase III subunit alpha, partial [Rhodospirillales bacterium]|nr:DNA polymerase III subunit alpha [Rhodospirillales bacterium]
YSRGSRYAFLTLSDSSGQYEVTIFSEVLALAREMLEVGTPLLIHCDARIDDEQLRLTGHIIERLEEVAARTAAGLRIVIQDPLPIKPLSDILGKEQRGRGRVILVPRIGSREVEIALGRTFALSPATLSAVRSLPGVVEVQEI